MNEPRPTRSPSGAPAGAHQAHAHRADPHTAAHPRGARAPGLRAALAVSTALLAFLSAACDGGAGTPAAAGTRAIDQQIRDLKTALRPLEAGEHLSDVGDWNVRRDALVERMKAGPPELGRAALEELYGDLEQDARIQYGLLTVAAHAATEDALPRLEEIFTTYGERLDMRAHACDLLAEVAPERAVALIEPVLREARPSATWPPYERMLAAYVAAAERAEHDPVPLLAQITTDIYYDDDVRHRAAKSLGDHDHPLGAQALETVLVESTGNTYLRRLAAQALVRSATERCCTVIADVIQREVDTGFVLFLDDMIAKNCR